MSPAAVRAAGVVVNSVLERETCVDVDEPTLELVLRCTETCVDDGLL